MAEIIRYKIMHDAMMFVHHLAYICTNASEVISAASRVAALPGLADCDPD